MRDAAIVLSLLALLAAGCERPVSAEIESPATETAAAPPAMGPRWVVIKAEGLNCSACAAALMDDLQQVAGITKIETFAPQPYCPFYVEDGSLDVSRLLNELNTSHSAALEGYTFVRGG